MSVPTWKRKTSRSQFEFELFQLNVRVGEIVENKPKKYRDSYGDELRRMCLQALECASLANDIFLKADTPQDEKDERKRLLLKSRNIVKTVVLISQIYLELVRKCDGINNEKIYKEEADIGRRCDEIIALLNGTLKSDKKIG